ncbi:hypothetical protein DDZ13_12660 [Coraliomargarita sinensis]|uniref:Ice-binding protein C-terminal domain-containing protein n=1 Tax=Coraliomargarita sinensis TaxID=2174842 RepID=A0A317ZIR6_9BACT|nr:PEP-CTERM sorting domain-containing protein [Coraliomargarita sinensis]PXA03271.1 hypothetical protein DDZ13_12660 [Coraliomargarita sinensis]
MNDLPFIPTLSAVFLAVSALSAQTLFYEGFDYNTGDLSTETSGVWSDNGSTIESPGMSWGSLSVVGNKVTMSDDSSWTDIGSTFDTFMDDGDTLWFSVIINTISGSNPDFAFALSTDEGNDTNNVPLQNSGDGIGFRIKGGLEAATWSGGVVSSSSGVGYTSGTDLFVVGEIIFGATDTINIYTPGTDLVLGDVQQTVSASLTQSNFDTITFWNKTSDPRAETDEIRFGISYADVTPVPEPGTFALLGGLLALTSVMLRRRRS